MAVIAGDDLAYLEQAAGQLWGKVASRKRKSVILDKERLLKLPPALQRHLLRTAIEGLSGSLRDIESKHIEEILAALRKPAGKKLNLPGGLVFSIDYERYVLSLDEEGLSPFLPLQGEFALKIPGVTLLPGWRVKASIGDREQFAWKDGDFVANFDLARTGENLIVRSRRPGDRFQPLGMEQTKKLGQFMIDARVPRAWRRHIPIVRSPDQVLWVVGWRIDDRVKVVEDTKQILRLQFDQIDNNCES
jgi:tRNA(Ile)-lysidine synthase